MRRVIEQGIDDRSSGHKLWCRVHPPVRRLSDTAWGCRLELGHWRAPRSGYGETALQALSLTLSMLSVTVFASRAYRDGDLHVAGRRGGDLGIPASWRFLDRAPYPFSLVRARGRSRFVVVNDAGPHVRLLAEEVYRVRGSPRRLRARIFAPRLCPDGQTWSCDVSAGAPLGMHGQGLGQSGLQAVFAGLALLSMHLYGSMLYRKKRLGWDTGADEPKIDFGGHLLLPAVTEVLDDAPYPF